MHILGQLDLAADKNLGIQTHALADHGPGFDHHVSADARRGRNHCTRVDHGRRMYAARLGRLRQ